MTLFLSPHVFITVHQLVGAEEFSFTIQAAKGAGLDPGSTKIPPGV
jgi:hypothetical protein